ERDDDDDQDELQASEILPHAADHESDLPAVTGTGVPFQIIEGGLGGPNDRRRLCQALEGGTSIACRPTPPVCARLLKQTPSGLAYHSYRADLHAAGGPRSAAAAAATAP